jgi:mannose-6-phosphate isomerase-like protein (cupin superfamily)
MTVPDSPNSAGLDRFTFATRRVDKPWGYEIIWAESEQYVGKILFVKAGNALSLQYHEVKDETVYVHEGKVQWEIGEPGAKTLDVQVVGPGTSFRITPGTIHRMTAVEDTLMLEVSTPHLGDVVRLEDRYGRAGT